MSWSVNVKADKIAPKPFIIYVFVGEFTTDDYATASKTKCSPFCAHGLRYGLAEQESLSVAEPDWSPQALAKASALSAMERSGFLKSSSSLPL